MCSFGSFNVQKLGQSVNPDIAPLSGKVLCFRTPPVFFGLAVADPHLSGCVCWSALCVCDLHLPSVL